MTFVGKFAGINCFEYDGIYVTADASGNDIVNDLIAPDQAILASTLAAGSMVYGAIAISEEVGVEIYAAKRVPHSWADKDASKWTQRVSSRYCPCPADSSSWQTYANVIDKTIVQPARAKGGARKE